MHGKLVLGISQRFLPWGQMILSFDRKFTSSALNPDLRMLDLCKVLVWFADVSVIKLIAEGLAISSSDWAWWSTIILVVGLTWLKLLTLVVYPFESLFCLTLVGGIILVLLNFGAQFTQAVELDAVL